MMRKAFIYRAFSYIVIFAYLSSPLIRHFLRKKPINSNQENYIILIKERNCMLKELEMYIADKRMSESM